MISNTHHPPAPITSETHVFDDTPDAVLLGIGRFTKVMSSYRFFRKQVKTPRNPQVLMKATCYAFPVIRAIGGLRLPGTRATVRCHGAEYKPYGYPVHTGT